LDNVHIPARILEGDFAGWLRDAMNEWGMSPRMVGLRAGIDPHCVTQILYGGREPSIATALALLRLFETELSRSPTPNNVVSHTSLP
jgi:DNA-binding XRE family transcriptional regulator